MGDDKLFGRIFRLFLRDKMSPRKSNKMRRLELSVEFLVEFLLVLVPLGRDVMGLPPNVPLGIGIWSVAAIVAIRIFWIWEWTERLTTFTKVLVSVAFLALVVFGTWESAMEGLLLQHPLSQDAQSIPPLPRRLIPPMPSGIFPKPQPPEKPDIGLEFVGPGDVGFRMINLSNVVLQEPKYTLLLFDLDGPKKSFPNGTAAPEPLPIPTEIEHDFMRPKDKYLWRPIVSTFPAVQAIVKSGDRIFGLGFVSCPHCIIDRTYWVYFVVGGGGWYSEVAKDRAKIPMGGLLSDTQGTLDNLVPATKRIAIGAP